MKRHCCYINESYPILISDGYNIDDVPCRNVAEWVIVDGEPWYDHYTDACTEHVGALLSDAPEQRVYPIDPAERS